MSLVPIKISELPAGAALADIDVFAVTQGGITTRKLTGAQVRNGLFPTASTAGDVITWDGSAWVATEAGATIWQLDGSNIVAVGGNTGKRVGDLSDNFDAVYANLLQGAKAESAGAVLLGSDVAGVAGVTLSATNSIYTLTGSVALLGTNTDAGQLYLCAGRDPSEGYYLSVSQTGAIITDGSSPASYPNGLMEVSGSSTYMRNNVSANEYSQVDLSFGGFSLSGSDGTYSHYITSSPTDISISFNDGTDSATILLTATGISLNSDGNGIKLDTLAGTGTRVVTATAAGVVSGLVNSTDGKVLTLVSGVPAWADSGLSAYLPLAGGTITGNLSVNGNTTLGDAAGDTLTVNATPTFLTSVDISRATSTFSALTTRQTGDSTQRFNISANGLHSWGSGSAALDTNLYRSAANELKTDDSLVVALNTTLGTTSSDTLTIKAIADSTPSKIVGIDSSNKAVTISGWTGSFVNGDGATVTVVSGIITAVTAP